MSNRLTIKGQVTIPKEIRDFLGLTEGASAVNFEIADDGSVRVTRAQSLPGQKTLRTSRPGSVAPCDRILGLLAGSYV